VAAAFALQNRIRVGGMNISKRSDSITRYPVHTAIESNVANTY
jgi:hypothetical protein